MPRNLPLNINRPSKRIFVYAFFLIIQTLFLDAIAQNSNPKPAKQFEHIRFLSNSTGQYSKTNESLISAKTGPYLALVFHSIYCGPCRRNVIPLERLKHRLIRPESLKIISLNFEEQDRSLSTTFEHGLRSYPIVFDNVSDSNSLSQYFNIQFTPTLKVLDTKTLEVVYSSFGVLTSGDEYTLLNLLNQQEGS